MPEVDPITLSTFVRRVREAAAGRARLLVALAGPPGSGKSTAAEAVTAALEAEAPGSAVLVPMDGFHYDDAVLVPRGLRPRKGAPETFDVGGLAATLRRLRSNDEPEVALPVFDRAQERSRAAARVALRETPIVLVEGNYLLLDEPHWRDLRALFDLTAAIRCPVETLRRRLIARWSGFGFEPEAARLKAESNDIPNARRVLDRSLPPDLVIDGEAPSDI